MNLTHLLRAFETHLNDLKLFRDYSSIFLDDGSTGSRLQTARVLVLFVKKCIT